MSFSTQKRLNALLNADKQPMNEACKTLALKDFARIAEEYFDLSGEAQLQIEQVGVELKVSVCFTASRVKNFTSFR